jgi:hypothetical protein
MGKSEKLSALIGAALLGLVAIAAAYYNHQTPNWQPVIALLYEIALGAGAGSLSFTAMERLKQWTVIGNASKLVQSYVHIAIASALGIGCWFALVGFGAVKVTEEGAVAVALTTYGVGKQIWQHYKNQQEKKTEAILASLRAIGEAEAEAAKPLIKARLDAYVGKVPQGHTPYVAPIAPVSGPYTDDTDLSNSGDAMPYPDGERGPSGGC